MESDTVRQRFVHGDEEQSRQQQFERNSRQPLFLTNSAKIMTCILCGAVFGFVAEKGQVVDPRAIRYQMIFKKMIMMKMFLSALSAGMFGLAMLAMIPATSKKFFNCCTEYYRSLTNVGVLACIVGGSLLGVGMTIAGSCPTMIFGQIGAMVPNAGYTTAGAFFGTLIYGLLKPTLDRATKPVITESSNPWNNSPFFIMALPIAMMFGMIVSSFEILYPWTRDVKNVKEVTEWMDIFTLKSWPPFVCGAVTGGLQIPLALMLGETLGGSASIITLLSQVFVGPFRRISPFICSYKRGFESWWKVYFITGVIFGAYLSAASSGYLGKAHGVPAMHAFIGGTMMFLGARIAGGCTSGHGLSGMSLLSILSMITTACMFGSAILTGLVMNYYKVLKI